MSNVVVLYRIARNFRGKKLSQIGGKYDFFQEHFRGLLAFATPKDASPLNFMEKTFAKATKPQNLWKFSPAKVSRYTVYEQSMYYIFRTVRSRVMQSHPLFWPIPGHISSAGMTGKCTYTTASPPRHIRCVALWLHCGTSWWRWIALTLSTSLIEHSWRNRESPLWPWSQPRERPNPYQGPGLRLPLVCTCVHAHVFVRVWYVRRAVG